MRKQHILLAIGMIVFVSLFSCSQKAFEWPSNDDFSFEVNYDESAAKVNEEFEIHCKLTNTTERDYHIEHGSETITYDWDGKDEILLLISTMDVFESNGTIERTIKIRPTQAKTCKLVLNASFSVTPEKNSNELKDYNYSKEFMIEVKE